MSHVRLRAALILPSLSKRLRLFPAFPSVMAISAALVTLASPSAAQPTPADQPPQVAPVPAPATGTPSAEPSAPSDSAAGTPLQTPDAGAPVTTETLPVAAEVVAPTPPPAPATVPVAVPPAASTPVLAMPKLVPYGFVRLDMIFNDSRFQSAQSPLWVLSEAEGAENDADLSIHPRLTRLGLDIGPVELTDVTKVDGKIEIDFQNGGSESRQALRMRHAYAQVKHGAVEVLFGQTWDLLSPLFPMANNDTLMWNAGNIGDRRPQLRLTVRPAVGDGYVRVAASAGMPNAVDSKDLDENGRPDGVDATVPLMQGLLEAGIPLGKETLKVGAFGHYGREEVGKPIGGETEFDSWSAGFHAFVPLTAMAWVQGEAFMGRNLSDVRGGIGQGVQLTTGKEIRSRGGWAELGVALLDKKYSAAVGGTIDKPESSDLPDGGRTQNRAFFVAQKLVPAKVLAIGLDYIYWQTRYKNTPDGDAHRFDLHVSMPF